LDLLALFWLASFFLGGFEENEMGVCGEYEVKLVTREGVGTGAVVVQTSQILSSSVV